MRRALLALTLGGVLLTGAACGSDDTGDTATGTPAAQAPAAATESPAASQAPAEDYSADTKAICTKVETIFGEDLTAFGTELGKMIAYREADASDEAADARKDAAAELTKIATSVRKTTAAAKDPELVAAGAESATKIQATAKSTAFFDKLKTEKDLDAALEPEMMKWMLPVVGFCA